MGASSHYGGASGLELVALLLLICLISVDNYAAYHTPAGKAGRDTSLCRRTELWGEVVWTTYTAAFPRVDRV
jgi:hypothetical protein